MEGTATGAPPGAALRPQKPMKSTIVVGGNSLLSDLYYSVNNEANPPIGWRPRQVWTGQYATSRSKSVQAVILSMFAF